MQPLSDSEERKEYHRQYYQKNKAKFNARTKAYRQANKEKVNAKIRERYQAQSEEQKEKRRKWFREYYAKNKNKCKEKWREWAKKNRLKRNAYARNYNAKHKEQIRATARRHHKKMKGRPTTQWEITLNNGMKQYVLGRTEAEAINRLRSWVPTSRKQITMIKMYGEMPARKSHENGN
jgi:hypothetical protein